MCGICLCSPCNSRCPNAPDPRAVYACAGSGEPIYKGDKFVWIGDAAYSLDYVEDSIKLSTWLDWGMIPLENIENTTCVYCREWTAESIQYADLDSGLTCIYCLEQMTANEWFKEMGIDIETA